MFPSGIPSSNREIFWGFLPSTMEEDQELRRGRSSSTFLVIPVFFVVDTPISFSDPGNLGIFPLIFQTEQAEFGS